MLGNRPIIVFGCSFLDCAGWQSTRPVGFFLDAYNPGRLLPCRQKVFFPVFHTLIGASCSVHSLQAADSAGCEFFESAGPIPSACEIYSFLLVVFQFPVGVNLDGRYSMEYILYILLTTAIEFLK
jgi:hypothetical protein